MVWRLCTAGAKKLVHQRCKDTVIEDSAPKVQRQMVWRWEELHVEV